MRTWTAPVKVFLPVSMVRMDNWSGDGDTPASSEDNRPDSSARTAVSSEAAPDFKYREYDAWLEASFLDLSFFPSTPLLA